MSIRSHPPYRPLDIDILGHARPVDRMSEMMITFTQLRCPVPVFLSNVGGQTEHLLGSVTATPISEGAVQRAYQILGEGEEGIRGFVETLSRDHST